MTQNWDSAQAGQKPMPLLHPKQFDAYSQPGRGAEGESST